MVGVEPTTVVGRNAFAFIRVGITKCPLSFCLAKRTGSWPNTNGTSEAKTVQTRSFKKKLDLVLISYYGL